MEIKHVYYTIIPLKVLHDKRLPAAAKLLYAEIKLLSDIGPCTVTNAYFEKTFDISKSSVKRYLKALKDCGHIKITHEYKDTKELDKRVIIPILK